MSRILRSKGILITLVTFSVLVSALNIYRTIFYKNFAIFQSEQSITIAFNNGKYISLRPVADTITDLKANTIKPFGEFNDYTFNTSGITLGPISSAYNLKLSNNKASTNITVQQVGSTSLNLRYKIDSIYDLNQQYKYQIELDYSGQSQFKKDALNISLVDAECSIAMPVSTDYQIANFSGGRSLLFSKTFEKDLEFNITININCNEN